MEKRALGRTGLTVSAVGFGCGAIGGLMVKGDPAEQRRAVARALEAGFRYFDTAPSYGDGRSEENLGRVLQELGADPIVGTKFRIDPTDLGDVPGAIRRSLETSLRRLRRDRVHLLQLHNQIGGTGLPVEVVLGPVADGLDAVRAAGLVDHIGITGTGDTAAIHHVIASGRFVSAQSYFNALNPSAGWAGRYPAAGQDYGGLIDRAAEGGMGIIVIRPFAAGAIAARPDRHANAGDPGTDRMGGAAYAEDLTRAQALANLARELELDGPLELALRFALAKPGISTVLVGFSDDTQLGDAIRWAERGPLIPAAVDRLLATVS